MLTENKRTSTTTIRWVLCFPVAFIAGAAAVFISAIFMDSNSALPGEGFAAMSTWFAIVSVKVAKWIAPLKKQVAGSIMLLISLAISLFFIIYFWEELNMYAILLALFATAGLGMTALVLGEKTD